jgi:hydrogenase expression/formation protein HypE
MSKILLAHGSGGKLMHNLIEQEILKRFANPFLSPLADSAVFSIGKQKFAFTTDSYVVKPIFFPGGDIGKLAIYGTVNDLSMVGAEPLYLSCGVILEEGLETEILDKILASMEAAGKNANVKIVTGDTKVVEKNSADKIFINTAGVGIIKNNRVLSTDRIRKGDKIIINGSIGDHGIAVMSERMKLKVTFSLKSDCAPLWSLVEKILGVSNGAKFMRDPTRGGLATTLNEIVARTNLGILIREEDIPVKDEVKGISELLGLDPLYVANEGKAVIVVSPEAAEKVLRVMKKDKLGKESRIIGEIVETPEKVILKTLIGGHRIVDMLTGEQLPRIC